MKVLSSLLLSAAALSATADDDEGSKKEPVGTVIGIDLGTTYSCVGVFKSGRVEIVANDQGNRITPSWVAWDPANAFERVVGDAAKNLATVAPEQTIFDVKRLIGRKFSDKSVQHDKKLLPFEIVDVDGKPAVSVKTGEEETKTFAAEEVSAMILQKMKATAEAYLGTSIKNAVVTSRPTSTTPSVRPPRMPAPFPA